MTRNRFRLIRGKPAPTQDSHGYTELRAHCVTWRDVFDVIRLFVRRGEVQLVSLVSFHSIRNGHFPVYRPADLEALDELSRKISAELTSARNFRLRMHPTANTRSVADQTPLMCITVAWTARGEDIDQLLDAIREHASGV